MGVAGVVLFNGPLTPTKDSCYCLIPSPEPGAAQGTASILLVLGVLFLPIGFLKGGLPTFGRKSVATPKPQAPTPSGGAVTSLPMRSGKFYTLGIALIVIGVDAVAIPSFLLYHNFLIGGVGAAVTALGLLAFYLGIKS